MCRAWPSTSDNPHSRRLRHFRLRSFLANSRLRYCLLDSPMKIANSARCVYHLYMKPPTREQLWEQVIEITRSKFPLVKSRDMTKNSA